MTGTDRYSDAVALLTAFYDRDAAVYGDPQLLAEAQVHATLALAAATALATILPIMGHDSEEVTAWAKVVAPDLLAGGCPTRGPRPPRTWSDCCGGTGLDDMTPLPCQNPTCPVLAEQARPARGGAQ